ncbi:hypothetical protein B0O79_2255 [Flavobacteriaceae bacterium MAR_2009_75]|nr:hypothetical protein B0O79_2255 [Flavobacteriaceae bacterium MAR_2009_75]
MVGVIIMKLRDARNRKLPNPIKMKFLRITLIRLVTIILTCNLLSAQHNKNDIQPYHKNPWYWQYEDNPVLLTGGSDEDNLFQWTGKKLIDHLDLLVSVGGNYVRNTMSDRDEGNVYAFKMTKSGKYDLTKWNPEYWNRLTFFLDETSKRDIIVQLTLWDHFDITSSSRWKVHPWNHENNINPKSNAWKDGKHFFRSVNDNDSEQIELQENFIEKLLSLTLKYTNVLYNIDNESNQTTEWENHWATFIKEQSHKHNKKVFTTTLQMDPANAVRHVMTYGDIFQFADISQNNQDSRGGRGNAHWDNLMYLRDKIASYGPFPINNVKIYGGEDGKNYSAGSESEAMDRFWRNIIGGCAAARFHRPALPRVWGSGLNKRAQTNLEAMNMLLKELDIFSCSPHNDLIVPRVRVPSIMQAYATANIGNQYAIYFPQGRHSISFDPWVYVKKLRLRWLDIDNLKWSEPKIINVDWSGAMYDWGNRGEVLLETPENSPFVALLEVVE